MISKNIISVDLGGTWIRAASVSRDGMVVGKTVRRPTKRNRAGMEILSDIKEVVEEVIRDQHCIVGNVEAIAMGVPSPVNQDGDMRSSDNLPTISGTFLKDRLMDAFEIPVYMFNDATCFAFGEWKFGAGRNCVNFCGVTLGTGLGVGVIANNMPYFGSHGCAGELWKSPSVAGNIEALLSGRRIEMDYERVSGCSRTGAEISSLANNGDSISLNVYAQFGKDLGAAVSHLINIMDPDLIAFGGSVSDSFEWFCDSLRETVLENTVAGSKVSLLKSILGEEAALRGASGLYCLATLKNA